MEKRKKSAISKLHRKLQANRELYSEGDRTREEYQRTKTQVEREIAHWESRTTEVEKKAVELRMCIDALHRLKECWNESTNEEKQLLAQGLFERIIYDLDKQVITGFILHAWADSYVTVRADLLASERGESKTVQASSYVPFDTPNGIRSNEMVFLRRRAYRSICRLLPTQIAQPISSINRSRT